MNERDEAYKIIRRLDSMRLTSTEQQVLFEHLYAQLHGRRRGKRADVPTFLAEFETYFVTWLIEARSRPSYNTGFSMLDQALGGMSAVTVLTGMPGQGKTTFGIQTMLAQLAIGTPVLFLSFDISRRDVITHFIRRLSGLSFAQIVNNAPGVFTGEHESSLNVGQVAAYMAAYETMQGYDALTRIISPEDGFEITEANLLGEIEALTQATGRPPLVVVDYIGALAPYLPEGVEPAVERAIHMISRLALVSSAPWLVLSQRARANYGNAGLDGSKGSGEIEAKAFTVLSLDKRMDVPDEIDYPAWVKTVDHKAKYAAQIHGVERMQALLGGTRRTVTSKLVLHINKDRNALGGGAMGAAINMNMEHGFLVEEPFEKVPVLGEAL